MSHTGGNYTGGVLIGDLSSCHAGIGFVFRREHYVSALDLNTIATKGWSAPVRVSGRLFELCCAGVTKAEKLTVERKIWQRKNCS